MFRKFICAAAVSVVLVGVALSDEFYASITKIDGDNVTFQKMTKGKKGAPGEKDGDPVTISAKGAKVFKAGKYDKDSKSYAVGDAIEDGLKAKTLTAATADKGVNAWITTDASNKTITQILVVGGKMKKKKTDQ